MLLKDILTKNVGKHLFSVERAYVAVSCTGPRHQAAPKTPSHQNQAGEDDVIRNATIPLSFFIKFINFWGLSKYLWPAEGEIKLRSFQH
jgi:hypothetical protein